MGTWSKSTTSIQIRDLEVSGSGKPSGEQKIRDQLLRFSTPPVSSFELHTILGM